MVSLGSLGTDYLSCVARRRLNIESVVSEIDIFISSSANFNIITLVRMKKLKNILNIGNSCQFDNEIDLAGSEGLEGTKVDIIKPLTCVCFPRWSRCDRAGLQERCCGAHCPCSGQINCTSLKVEGSFKRGHFDNAMGLAGSEGLKGMNVDNNKPQKVFSSSPSVTV